MLRKWCREKKKIREEYGLLPYPPWTPLGQRHSRSSVKNIFGVLEWFLKIICFSNCCAWHPSLLYRSVHSIVQNCDEGCNDPGSEKYGDKAERWCKAYNWTFYFNASFPYIFVYILLPLHKLLGAAGTFDVVVNIMVDLVLWTSLLNIFFLSCPTESQKRMKTPKICNQWMLSFKRRN